MKIDILGLSEVRWTQSGKMAADDTTLIYSGETTHHQGVGFLLGKEAAKAIIGYWPVSERIILVKLKAKPLNIALIQIYAPTTESTEEEVERFYEKLDAAMKQCKSQEIKIVMGDMNAKVGQGRYEDSVGSHGLGARKNEAKNGLSGVKGTTRSL